MFSKRIYYKLSIYFTITILVLSRQNVKQQQKKRIQYNQDEQTISSTENEIIVNGRLIETKIVNPNVQIRNCLNSKLRLEVMEKQQKDDDDDGTNE